MTKKQDRRIGQHVRIHRNGPLTPGGIDAAFQDATGRIVGVEMGMYRVQLDTAVNVESVGRVTSDLWCGPYLKRID